MRSVLFLVVVALVASSSIAATIYVPRDYPTIQGAIDAAVAGDTIIVSPGTYYENVVFRGKAVTLKSAAGPSRTAIDAGKPINPDFGSAVRFQDGEMPDSVLNGFTLRNGMGSLDQYSHHVGGGVFCYQAHPTIVNNVISNNNTADNGGGIWLGESHATIEHNEIRDNIGWAGGGLYCKESDPLIENNLFFNNTASAEGGAINCWKSPAVIVGNVFSQNSGGAAGAIDCVTDSHAVITNNIIYNNTARQYGGGIRAQLSSPILTNNTIVGNKAEYGMGGGLYIENGDVVVSNTIFWDDAAGTGAEIHMFGSAHIPSTLTINHSLVKGGQSSCSVGHSSTLNWGSGMIDADPLFADPADYDFHLTWLSPCRNAGDNSAVTGLYDFEGDPRTAQGTVDIGADEYYPHLYHGGEVKPGGTVTFKAIGIPGAGSTLCHGLALHDPPLLTPYGELHIKFPLSFHNNGTFPANGYSEKAYTLPMGLYSGQKLYYQLFTGGRLWNLMTLKVE